MRGSAGKERKEEKVERCFPGDGFRSTHFAGLSFTFFTHTEGIVK